MSSANHEPSFLSKLADLFRAQADTATADALVVARFEPAPTRSISEADYNRIRELQRKGLRLDSQGNHAAAERFLADALRLAEDALGCSHVDLIEHLNDLARCRFNDGSYGAAVQDYQRLLWLVQQHHGPDDMLARIVRHSIETCRHERRIGAAARRLHAHLDNIRDAAPPCGTAPLQSPPGPAEGTSCSDIPPCPSC